MSNPNPIDNRRSARRLDRALGDLRRGVPVLLVDGAEAALAMAAEYAGAEAEAEFAALGAGPAELLLTDQRADVLHIRPAGEPLVALRLGGAVSWPDAAELPDPTLDLGRPLRGPFPVVERAASSIDRAAIALCKAARLLPAAVVAPVAAGEEGEGWGAERGFLALDAAAVVSGAEERAVTLTRVAAAAVPLEGAEKVRIVAFRPDDGGLEHLAILIGDPPRAAPVLARLHSECFTGDLLASLRCDCGPQLRGAIEAMARAGEGVLLYLAQEGRGIGLINKLRAYQLQDQGFDTIEANERLGFEGDERLFRPAAEMLRQLGFAEVRLMTNNPDKVEGLERCGIRVVERVAHAFPATGHNARYLDTKKRRKGHLL